LNDRFTIPGFCRAESLQELFKEEAGKAEQAAAAAKENERRGTTNGCGTMTQPNPKNVEIQSVHVPSISTHFAAIGIFANQNVSLSGWCFGTMEFYDFPFSWECHIPNCYSLHHFPEG